MPKGIPKKKYTGEFKQKVIETMIEKKLGYNETAKEYEVKGHNVIQNWERIYLAEGAEGLYIERRGRASIASGSRKGRPTKFPKQVEEDMLDELQCLRAENAYLKKLNALVSKRVQQEKKHR